MYTYTHDIHMCIYIYIYVFPYLSVCVHMYVCLCAHMHVCRYAYMYVCMYACVNVCIYVCVCVCVCVCKAEDKGNTFIWRQASGEDLLLTTSLIIRQNFKVTSLGIHPPHNIVTPDTLLATTSMDTISHTPVLVT